MTLALMLHEQGHDKGQQSKKEKASKDVPLVLEEKEEDETLSEQAKASMALMLLQTRDSVDEEDRLLEPEEVEDAVPDLDFIHPQPHLGRWKRISFPR